MAYIKQNGCWVDDSTSIFHPRKVDKETSKLLDSMFEIADERVQDYVKAEEKKHNQLKADIIYSQDTSTTLTNSHENLKSRVEVLEDKILNNKVENTHKIKIRARNAYVILKRRKKTK